MADEWGYESSLTWAGGALSGEYLPVMLRSGAGTFFQADSSLAPTSTSLSARLERIGIPLFSRGVSPTVRKLISGLWLVVSGTPGDQLSVYVGAQAQSPVDAPVYEGPFTFIIGQTEYLDPLIEGRYACLKITSTGTYPWTLVSYAIDFSAVGEH